MPQRDTHLDSVYRAARSRLQAAIEADPGEARLHLELGSLAYLAGDFDAAEESLRRASDLDRDDPRAVLRLGDVLAESGRQEEAAACFREAAQLAEGTPLGEDARAEVRLAERELKIVHRPLDEMLASLAGRVPSAGELNRLGGLCLLAGRTEDAAGAFRRACELDPASPQAALNFGFLQTLTAVEPSRLKLSVSELTEALRRFPEEPRLYLHLAEIYETSSLYDAAIQRIARALDVAPGCVEAYDLAARYALLGNGCAEPLERKIDAILDRAERELAASPADAAKKKALALALVGRARYDKAGPGEYARPCELLEDLAGEDIDAAVRLAECTEIAGDAAAAEAILREAAALAVPGAPGSHRPAFELAALALRGGRPDEAVELFVKAAELAPEEATIYQSLRYALSASRRLTTAELAARAELARDPASADARLRLGGAYLDASKTAEAVEVLREAADLAPDRAGVRAELGRALARAGRTGEAEACYRRAIDLDPASASAHRGLGGLLLEDPARMREGLAELETYRKLMADGAEA